MMGLTLKVRHGAAFINVDSGGNEEACLKALEQEAKKAGAEFSCMPGIVHESSMDELYGPGGKWSAELGKEKTWIGVRWGSTEGDAEKWEQLNTLLDDNKFLVTTDGGKVPLHQGLARIVFILKDVSTLTPATIY